MDVKIKNFDDLLLYSDLMTLVEVSDKYYKKIDNLETYLDGEVLKPLQETLNAIGEFEHK